MNCESCNDSGRDCIDCGFREDVVECVEGCGSRFKVSQDIRAEGICPACREEQDAT